MKVLLYWLFFLAVWPAQSDARDPEIKLPAEEMKVFLKEVQELDAIRYDHQRQWSKRFEEINIYGLTSSNDKAVAFNIKDDARIRAGAALLIIRDQRRFMLVRVEEESKRFNARVMRRYQEIPVEGRWYKALLLRQNLLLNQPEEGELKKAVSPQSHAARMQAKSDRSRQRLGLVLGVGAADPLGGKWLAGLAYHLTDFMSLRALGGMEFTVARASLALGADLLMPGWNFSPFLGLRGTFIIWSAEVGASSADPLNQALFGSEINSEGKIGRTFFTLPLGLDFSSKRWNLRLTYLGDFLLLNGADNFALGSQLSLSLGYFW